MSPVGDKAIILRIADNQDVIPEIKKFITSQSEKYLQITNMVGRLREFEIMITGRQSNSTKKFFRESHKIINSSGMFENTGGEPEVKIHMSLSKDGFSSSGGRLLSGKASGELIIGLKSVEENKAVKMW